MTTTRGKRALAGLAITVRAWAATIALAANVSMATDRQDTKPCVQQEDDHRAAPKQARNDYYGAPGARIEAWRTWKFGFVSQWNMSSLTQREIGHSRGAPRRGGEAPQARRAYESRGKTPGDVYDNLYQQPWAQNFNARELCKILKDGGMRYGTLCVKHHDGFCMWDTKLSDYKVTAPECAVRRDLFREWVDASREAGLGVQFYFSQPDWYHPDYLRSGEAHARYLKTMHGWMRELCSNYGVIDGIFFDGLGNVASNWDSFHLFQTIRELQPNVVLNNRCGDWDMVGWPIDQLPKRKQWQQYRDSGRQVPGCYGDYDTPEQDIGRFQPDRPWESCYPMQKNPRGGRAQWSWDSKLSSRTFEEILGMLITVVGQDGNLLLCVAIRPDGTFEPRQVEVLRRCGEWLRRYGESIYATRGGPYHPLPLRDSSKVDVAQPMSDRPPSRAVSTHRDNKIYVHILDWSGDDLELPPISRRLVRSSVLTGGTAAVAQDEKGAIRITVPKEYRRALDTIVVLELDGPAQEARPNAIIKGSLAKGKRVRASNVFGGVSYFDPSLAVDDDLDTRWAADFNAAPCWLEVDLGKEETIRNVLIAEAFQFNNRAVVSQFNVQYKTDHGESWQTVLRGGVIGEDYRGSFAAVQARYVRLNILKADAPQSTKQFTRTGPSICEFQVY